MSDLPPMIDMLRECQGAIDALGAGRPGAIDAAHLAHQREWSERTFGPGDRTIGLIDHVSKELVEVAEDPTRWEWIDVIILALDGLLRAGHEPQAIVDEIIAKQRVNEARMWPDWRTAAPGKAIEHVREVPCQDCIDSEPQTDPHRRCEAHR
jgi:hypothetical protein